VYGDKYLLPSVVILNIPHSRYCLLPRLSADGCCLCVVKTHCQFGASLNWKCGQAEAETEAKAKAEAS